MREIKKSEIEVFITDNLCAVTGPKKACIALEDFGAVRSSFRSPNGLVKAYILPLDKAREVCQWYDALPEVIHVAYFQDKRKLSRSGESKPKAKVVREYKQGIQAEVGDIYISAIPKRTIAPRAYQVIALEDGEATVREIHIKDGQPVKDDWVFNDHKITARNKIVEGRELKKFKK